MASEIPIPRTAATVWVIAADLAEPTSLDAIPPESQAGVLFGNMLQYFADPLPLLRTSGGDPGCRRCPVKTTDYKGEGLPVQPRLPTDRPPTRPGEMLRGEGLWRSSGFVP